MRYLIDTGVWLWLLSEPERIADQAVRVLDGDEKELFLSVASMWEVAVKWSKGKLKLPEPPRTHIPSRMELLGVQPLVISQRHVLAVAEMPHHRGDPFDRLLIAQALVEEMTLISADLVFRRYKVPLLWAGR